MVTRPNHNPASTAANSSVRAQRDPNTLSNYGAWRSRHIQAELDIDFGAKLLRGKVTLHFEKRSDDDQIILDTR